MPRIGYMALPTSTPNERLAAFKQSLRELGYVEGKNVAIEYRSAEGKYERFPEIAEELVRLKVNVILADDGTPSAIAARNATRTIPIVFTVVNDPVASGVVKTFSHPGGNITGLSLQSPETTAKRLQMLKEIIPSIRRVAVLVNRRNESMNVWRQALPDAARKLQIELTIEEAATPLEIETAFERAAQNGIAGKRGERGAEESSQRAVSSRANYRSKRPVRGNPHGYWLPEQGSNLPPAD